MARGNTIRIERMDDLRHKLQRIDKNTASRLKEVTRQAGGMVLKAAKANTPVRSGTLQASMRAAYDSWEHGSSAYIGTDSAYAHFVEHGTGARGASSRRPKGSSMKLPVRYNDALGGQKAQSPVLRALRDQKDPVEQLYRRALAAQIRKEAAK